MAFSAVTLTALLLAAASGPKWTPLNSVKAGSVNETAQAKPQPVAAPQAPDPTPAPVVEQGAPVAPQAAPPHVVVVRPPDNLVACAIAANGHRARRCSSFHRCLPAAPHRRTPGRGRLPRRPIVSYCPAAIQGRQGDLGSGCSSAQCCR